MGGELSAATLAAIGIALSPVPFLLAVVLLGADGVAARVVAFVSGEALAVAGVMLAAVFLFRAGDHAVTSTIGLLEITVGAVLAFLLGVHVRRARTAHSERLHGLLERVGTTKAFAGGVAMVLVNPKNLALALAGAAAILQLDYSLGGELASVLTFTAASVSVLVSLLVLAVAFPERSRTALERLTSFVGAHERTLVTVLLGLLSIFFLVRGILDSAA